MHLYGQQPAIAHCRALFEQPTPFPHIPFSYCTFAVHFNNLSVNFRRTNSTLKVAGFSVFLFCV